MHSPIGSASDQTGSDEMSRLTVVCAQASLRLAMAFLKSEGAAGAAGGVQIHGDMLGMARGTLVDVRDRLLEWLGGEGWTGGGLGAGESCSSLIPLDGDGSNPMSLKSSRYGSPSR